MRPRFSRTLSPAIGFKKSSPHSLINCNNIIGDVPGSEPWPCEDGSRASILQYSGLRADRVLICYCYGTTLWRVRIKWAFFGKTMGRHDARRNIAGKALIFQHEFFELSLFRQVFHLSPKRRMNAADYAAQVAPDQPGKFHDQAWKMADRAVRRMRRFKAS